ncbi:Uncharacterised protein [Mycobacteroides abscessus subsp. abscessus]|nr:Uncharacterised protein [Mycobacteroides abscessus subsp. abscessus]
MGLLVPTTSATVISRNEACTVVSVMPYMLINRGDCGWSWNQSLKRAGSSASPPKTTTSSPSRASCERPASAASSA